jgi:glycosyltransferase involved in cell wall biosynthesis
LSVLLDACGELVRRGVEFHLRIVGGLDPGVASSAQCAAELRRQLAGSGLGGVVELTGPVGGDDVAEVLATADVFVAPYVELASGDKDGIPTSMLEAMAAGVAVVCTDAGAITEAVTDGVEALVVPQRDAPALAAAITRLGADPGLRARLAAAAAARFDAEFDAAVVDRDMHARIRSLIAGS